MRWVAVIFATSYALFVSLMFIALWHRLRQIDVWGKARAARLLRCWKCGYDLRATPERCPECGTVPVMIEAPPVNQDVEFEIRANARVENYWR